MTLRPDVLKLNFSYYDERYPIIKFDGDTDSCILLELRTLWLLENLIQIFVRLPLILRVFSGDYLIFTKYVLVRWIPYVPPL